jgi:hypothetical protein
LSARKKIHTAQEAMAPVPNLDLEDSWSGHSMVRDHSGRFLPNLRDALYRASRSAHAWWACACVYDVKSTMKIVRVI